MKRLSVVLPAYNEELMVGKTCRVLREDYHRGRDSLRAGGSK